MRERLDGGRVELPAIELATPGQRVTASGFYALTDARGVFDLEADTQAEYDKLTRAIAKAIRQNLQRDFGALEGQA